jgi:hypothetical protein
VEVVDEPPFFEELMNTNDGTGITRQPFPRLRSCDVLSLSELDDVVPILSVELLMLLELDVTLCYFYSYHGRHNPLLDFEPLGQGFFLYLVYSVDVEP